MKKRYSKRLMQTREVAFEALKDIGQFDARHLMLLFHLNRREAKLILEAVEFFEEII